MAEVNNRYTTRFQKIPIINPDLIYLDGPDRLILKVKLETLQFHTKI